MVNELARLFCQEEKDILHHLLRNRGVGDISHRDPVDKVQVAIGEFSKSLLFPGKEIANEVLV